MTKNIIIGTWPLSGDFGNVSLQDVDRVLRACAEYDFKSFDTAPNYGNGFSEFCLGKFFHNDDSVIINTKIGSRPFLGKSFEIKELTKSFDESRKRLNRDAVHTLFLHNPRGEIDDYSRVIDFMKELKSKRQISQIGISLAKGFDYNKVVNLQEFDVIQDDANILNLEALNRIPVDKKLMARSPLASGILSGKLNQDSTFDSQDHRSEWLKGERLASLLKRVDWYKENFSDLEIPEVARRFLLSHERIGSIVIGIKRPEHVIQLREDLDKKNLSFQEITTIISAIQSDFGLNNEKHLNF